LAALLGDSKFEDLRKPGFLLPEISEATQAVDEVRDLSERLLFYLKYTPYLARTTAETGFYDALSQPEERYGCSPISPASPMPPSFSA